MLGFFSGPECPSGTSSECRLSYSNSEVTLIAWEPEYDSEGRQTNENPNTVTQTVHCRTCHATWTEIRQNKSSTFMRIG